VNRLHVISPGMLTTVQDLGRFGYTHYGISPSGAADPLALRAANLLVGNAENAAALEMTLTGGEFAFDAVAIIALAGADFGASLSTWQPVEVRAGEIVRCPAARNGARIRVRWPRCEASSRENRGRIHRLRPESLHSCKRSTARSPLSAASTIAASATSSVSMRDAGSTPLPPRCAHRSKRPNIPTSASC